MDFIKKHYEKVVLSAVLLGLVGALVFLPVLISNDRQRLEDIKTGIIGGRPRPLSALDLTEQDKALGRLESSYQLDFSTTNKLFNPDEWKRDYSGNLIKIVTGREIGVDAVVVTKITPLYLVVSLDAVQTNELGVIYVIGVQRQAALYPYKRQHYVTTGEKNDDFTLVAVKGNPDNPDALVLKLTDTGQTVSVSKDKPFRRVDAYEADLSYAPEKENYSDRRVGSIIPIGAENYLIVAIDQNEVILSAQSNQKKTTLRYAP